MKVIGEKELKLLSICFDNNPDKIEAFLELFNLNNDVSMPDIKMVLPEESCVHSNNDTCLLEFPDSIKKCKQPCNFYVSCDSIRKENLL